MTIRLGMHDRSFEHISGRLNALDLDLEIRTFADDGTFSVSGDRVAPESVDLDYMWFSSHLGGKSKGVAFDLALRCRAIDVLQTFNAGLDDPFYAKASRRGIRLCNSSAQGIAIAEYTFGQIMAVLQPIEQQRAQQADRIWQRTPFREIGGTCWLIVGYGPIGREISMRAKAFGAQVQVLRRSPSGDEVADRVGTAEEMSEMLGAADIVVIAAPLNDLTRRMVNADFLASAKPGAIVVNVARGGLVDDHALLAALDAGQISTAILDVFHTEPLPSNDPLWRHPGVRLTAHTSFNGDGVQGRWDQLFLDNIRRYAAGEPLLNLVDPNEI